MGMPPPHAVSGGETAQGCISELPRLLQNYTSPVNALLSHTLHRHRNAGMCFVSRAQGFAASGLPDPLQDSSYHVTGLCSNHAWLPVKNASAIGFFFFSLLLFFKAKLSFCKIQPLKAFFFQYLCFVTTSLQSTIDKTASWGWSENRLNCSPARVPLSTLQSQVRVISRVSFPGRSSAENEFINAPPGGPHGLPDSSDCDLADLPLPLLVLAYPDV